MSLSPKWSNPTVRIPRGGSEAVQCALQWTMVQSEECTRVPSVLTVVSGTPEELQEAKEMTLMWKRRLMQREKAFRADEQQRIRLKILAMEEVPEHLRGIESFERQNRWTKTNPNSMFPFGGRRNRLRHSLLDCL